MAEFKKIETASGEPRWKMRVFVGRDPATGKRSYIIRTFKRKKDAEAEARRLERMKDMGGVLAPTSKEPLAKYLTRWLDAKEGMIRARTAHDYRYNLRRYVGVNAKPANDARSKPTHEPPEGLPPIGTIPLNRLTKDAFEALYTALRDQGKAPRTIQYLHVVLRQALKDAVAARTLASNPTDFAKVPKRAKDADTTEDKTAVRAMDKDQAGRFLEAATADRYSALWHVLLLGGLRPSEALGLGWEHVDFETCRVHIQRTLTRVGVKGWRLVPTKTKRSRRAVPLPAVAMAELRKWKTEQARERLALGAEWKDHGLVFTSTFGSPLDLSNLYAGPFRRVMAKAELGEWGPRPKAGSRGPRGNARFKPLFRVYDLRHTCATLLLLAGEDLKVVSERLGHASIVLTADTYSHVLPTMQERAADKLEAMFGVGG